MTRLKGERAFLGMCPVKHSLVGIPFIDLFQLTLILFESFESLHYPELLIAQPLENVIFLIVFCGSMLFSYSHYSDLNLTMCQTNCKFN